MKELIYINACMRAGSRTRRIATPIIENLREIEERVSKALRELEDRARAMGADAVVGIDVDYEVLGEGGGMLMVTASGTAVRLG